MAIPLSTTYVAPEAIPWNTSGAGGSHLFTRPGESHRFRMTGGVGAFTIRTGTTTIGWVKWSVKWGDRDWHDIETYLSATGYTNVDLSAAIPNGDTSTRWVRVALTRTPDAAFTAIYSSGYVGDTSGFSTTPVTEFLPIDFCCGDSIMHSHVSIPDVTQSAAWKIANEDGYALANFGVPNREISDILTAFPTELAGLARVPRRIRLMAGRNDVNHSVDIAFSRPRFQQLLVLMLAATAGDVHVMYMAPTSTAATDATDAPYINAEIQAVAAVANSRIKPFTLGGKLNRVPGDDYMADGAHFNAYGQGKWADEESPPTKVKAMDAQDQALLSFQPTYYWRMNESAGFRSLADLGPHDLDLPLFGSPYLAESGPIPGRGYAVRFKDDASTSANYAQVDLTTTVAVPFTAVFWVRGQRAYADTGTEYIVRFLTAGGAANVVTLARNDAGGTAVQTPNGFPIYYASPLFWPGWFQVAIVHAGTMVYLYINGVLLASAADSLAATIGRIEIARSGNAGLSFSRLAMYPRALSATELVTIFGAGKVGPASTAGLYYEDLASATYASKLLKIVQSNLRSR